MPEVIYSEIAAPVKTINGFQVTGTCIRQIKHKSQVLELKVLTSTSSGESICLSVFIYGENVYNVYKKIRRKKKEDKRNPRICIEGYIDSGKRAIVVNGVDDYAYIERLVATKMSFAATQMELEFGITEGGNLREKNENKFKLDGLVYGAYTNAANNYAVMSIYTRPTNGSSFTRVLALGQNAEYIAKNVEQYDQVALIGEIRPYRPKSKKAKNDESEEVEKTDMPNTEPQKDEPKKDEPKKDEPSVTKAERNEYRRTPEYAFFVKDIVKHKVCYE